MRLSLLLLIFSVYRYTEANEKRQPDILLVIADDAGHADVGWYNEKMKSPFLDSLASDEEHDSIRSILRVSDMFSNTWCLDER